MQKNRIVKDYYKLLQKFCSGWIMRILKCDKNVRQLKMQKPMVEQQSNCRTHVAYGSTSKKVVPMGDGKPASFFSTRSNNY